MLKRNFTAIIDALDLQIRRHLNASGPELSRSLQLGEASRLLDLLLSELTFRFLALCIGKSSAALLKHLLLVLIHVDCVWFARLRLGIRIDLARSQLPRVRLIGTCLALSTVQQSFVLLDAHGRRPTANDWSDGPPLAREDLNQMKQFLFLFAAPLRLANGRVQPLVPA